MGIYRVYTKKGGVWDIFDNDVDYMRMPVSRQIRDYALTKGNASAGLIDDNLNMFNKDNVTIDFGNNKKVKATKLYYGEMYTGNAKKIIQYYSSKGLSTSGKLYINYIESEVSVSNKGYTIRGNISYPIIMRVVATNEEEFNMVKSIYERKGLSELIKMSIQPSKHVSPVTANGYDNRKYVAFLGPIAIAIIVILALVLSILVAIDVYHWEDVEAEMSRNAAYIKEIEAQEEVDKEKLQIELENLKERGKILNMAKIVKTWTAKDKNGDEIFYEEYGDGRIIAVNMSTGEAQVIEAGSLQNDKDIIEDTLNNMPNGNGVNWNNPPPPWDSSKIEKYVELALIAGAGLLGLYIVFKLVSEQGATKTVRMPYEAIRGISSRVRR